MALEAYSLCRPSPSTNNRIPLEVFYTSPAIKLHFPYAPFAWLPLLPPYWIHVIVGLLALGGILLALGFLSRISAAIVFLSWGYLYAVECTRTYWMSYYYLELLAVFLLILMPAARRYSIDAWMNRNKGLPASVPYWMSFLLRGQLVITYFYAGFAKVNADWLLDAQPVHYFLANAHLPGDLAAHLSQSHLQQIKNVLQSALLAYFISWTGVVFDLSIGFLMLFRRTRIFGFVLLLLFHTTNHFVIFKDIVWFPLLGVTTATIFLPPDWPEQFMNWLRRPRLARPEWPWFVAGGICFPVLGAALGWKARSSGPASHFNQPALRLRFSAAFVVVWLIWQTLMPLRHFIAGSDPRLSWEGVSFSWRLKAEVFRTLPCEFFLEDDAIVGRDSAGRTRIDWSKWRGEKVLHRLVTPGRINWASLPELLVVLEPMLGERIIYNPFATSGGALRSETQSHARVASLWQELYGRQPQSVFRALPPQQTLAGCQSVLQSEGLTPKSQEEFFDMLGKIVAEAKHPEVVGLLRHTSPFALSGERTPPTPFLWIVDEALVQSGQLPQIQSQKWAAGSCTRSFRDTRTVNLGTEPLVVYMADVGLEIAELMPEACIFDTQDHPEHQAYISWLYPKELTISQRMHVSMNPFLLRRYARHIAAAWQKEYGYLPSVHGGTAVSLNGRPFQAIVDPNVDLATAPLSLLGHNAWIPQLQTPRIPPGGLQPVNSGAINRP
jgi:hypothetical protein